MYTKLQQSSVRYFLTTDLLEVIRNHQAGLRLIRFERTPSDASKKGQYEVKTLADVIIGWANGERTIFVDDNTVQCAAGKRRSDLDLFLLCRYYFSMSYKEFNTFFQKLKSIQVTIPYGKDRILHGGYCSVIKRRVYYPIYEKNKSAVRENFSDIKLKINKTPNIGETIL